MPRLTDENKEYPGKFESEANKDEPVECVHVSHMSSVLLGNAILCPTTRATWQFSKQSFSFKVVWIFWVGTLIFVVFTDQEMTLIE